MNYNQVIGQKECKTRLFHLVTENRIPHAMLFTGPQGCGNLPMAFAFAGHLLCSKKLPEGPCGECSACKKTAKLIHPDLHIVFPIALNTEIRTSEFHIKKFREKFLENPYLSLDDWFSEISAENKLPVIGSDEVADILKKLSYTSYEGAYKILIMWLPEKLNDSASNKILKVLEEPSKDTMFILVSHQPDQLLSTIRSRVQEIPFTKLSSTEIKEAVSKISDLPEEKCRQIAYMADGDYNEALKLIQDSDEEFNLKGHFQTFMRLAFTFDYLKINEWVEMNAPLGREKHKQFFKYGLEMFRDCLMYNYGKRDLVRLNGTEAAFLEKFAPFINKNNYERIIEEFNSGYYYIERYANPKILFTDLFIRCNALIAPAKKA